MDGHGWRPYGPSWTAGGTIGRKRFVKQNSTAGQVLQATANAPIFGVAAPGTLEAPGLTGSDDTVAITSGKPVDVLGPGNIALVEVGAGVTITLSASAHNYVGSDSIGCATPLGSSTTTANRYYGGIALQGGVPGDEIEVFVMPGVINQ